MLGSLQHQQNLEVLPPSLSLPDLLLNLQPFVFAFSVDIYRDYSVKFADSYTVCISASVRTLSYTTALSIASGGVYPEYG